MSIDFSLITSVVQAIKDVKSVLDILPLNRPFMPEKEKLSDLKEQVSTVEKRINTGFPQLAQLVRSYSDALSEVKVAKSISDKGGQLIRSYPDLASSYTAFFANKLEDDYSTIHAKINRLPQLDVAQKGALDTHLMMIRDDIQDLQRVNKDDMSTFRRIFNEISTHYGDIERILSEFVEKILSSFNI